jgi:Circularly permutated YpsA SLOG family
VSFGYTPAMLERICSGGQTGADQAGLRAARSAGIPTGGWAPRGWATEDGPAPWLADFGLVECPEPGYPPRTRANVRDSDAPLWFGDWMTPGGKTTLDACRTEGKPFFLVHQGVTRPSQVLEWIEAKGVRVLNVAGNRHSKAPGIGARVERFLPVVFRGWGRAEG